MSSTDFMYLIRVEDPEYHYVVQKYEEFGDPVPEEYDVTFSKSTDAPWCNCMGMRHFAGREEEHKHVKMVRIYRGLTELKQMSAKFVVHERKIDSKIVQTVETITD